MTSFPTLPQSEVIAGLAWMGERLPYPEPDVKGDTFPITWADDDLLYTSAGDPLCPERIISQCAHDSSVSEAPGRNPRTAHDIRNTPPDTTRPATGSKDLSSIQALTE